MSKPELQPHRPRPAGAPTVLGGIRVIDFTRVIAGPYCAQTLGDLGAEVIKVENPAAGDDTRSMNHVAVEGETSPFLSLNRNKRSLALDLARPEARAIARALIDQADVVVENFSTGVMPKFGLDYESVSKSNPRLIYCSISAYGRSGKFATLSGYDPVTQAESGFMSMNGFPENMPVRTGVPIIDYSTGMMASNAILAALLAREKLGQGQYLELALFDQAVTMTGFYGFNFLVSGENQSRFGHAPGNSPTVGVFQAKDGPFYIACGNNRLFRRLVGEVLGRRDIADDPEFQSIRGRAQNRAKIEAVLSEIFATDSRDNWVRKLKAANAPAGPVRTIAEAFVSPEIAERGLATAIPHPKIGQVPNIAPPYRMSATPVVDPVAAPLLGQHTDQVLREVLGYDDGKIADLRKAGAFGER